MTLCEKVCLACLVVFGLLSILLGIVTLTVIEGIVDRTRDRLGYEELNGTRRLNPMTQKWVHPEYHMQVEIWMFNLMNHAEVLRGAKPRVQEIGPFTFMERQYKSPYQFDKNESRVFYRNNHVYVFNESLSCAHCSLDQRIVIPNVVFQKLVDFVQQGGYPAKFAIEALLAYFKRESPFIDVSVREALYDGYQDPLLGKVCSYNPVLRKLCEAAKIPERIGFFYGQNNTDDGLYEVSTGLNDVFSIGKVFTFNNMSVMPETVWDSADAREIRGTDGQLFPPLLEEGRELEVFAGQMCRSIAMQFLRRSDFQDVTAFRYGLPTKMFDPSIPENRGFCNKNGTPTFFNASIQIPGCLPKGLLDIGRCLPGTPRIYISNSHFFGADPAVISSIQGMGKPSEENDQTYVDIEPISGVPIFAKRVTQINVGMLKGNLNVLSNMNNITFPVLWMNETVYFDSDTRDQLSNLTSIKYVFILSKLSNDYFESLSAGVLDIGSLLKITFTLLVALFSVQ
ncbi:CD36 family protein [Ostertagia ostertagi]